MVRILFVDDDPLILQGLKRSLRPFRDLGWQVEMCTSGVDALQRFAAQPFDVVISDMMMPGMNGVQLLEHVQQRHPAALRFILSGHADRDLVLQSTRSAHRYFAKPCDVGTLVIAIQAGLRSSGSVPQTPLVEFDVPVDSIPCLPEAHSKLLELLRPSEPELDAVSAIVCNDIGMSARVLQLVNSSFFGLPTALSHPGAAVRFLGTDVMRGIAVTAGLFELTKIDAPGREILRGFTSHSIENSNIAALAGRELGFDKARCAELFQAALLHDVGHFVVAGAHPDLFVALHRERCGDEMALSEREQREIRCSHGRLGAYVLSRWGFAQAVVECVAAHDLALPLEHEPSDAIAALHIAHAVECRRGVEALPERLRGVQRFEAIVSALLERRSSHAA